jgi:hypothetical protein
VRGNQNRDTPLPPETPLGKNPPAGAVLDYVLGADARGPLTLEILDPTGKVTRRFSSDEPPSPLSATPYFAPGWLKGEPTPGATAGHHRFVWDFRGPRPKAIRHEYSIAATWGDPTPALPEGPLAPPGTYTVRLTVDGKSLTQPLSLKLDPRVRVAPAAITEQWEAAQLAASLMDRSFAALAEVRELRKELATAGSRSASLEREAAALAEGEGSFARLNGRLSTVLQAIDSADDAPTAQARFELSAAAKDLDELLARRKKLGSLVKPAK